jgi:hypothetical protein
MTHYTLPPTRKKPLFANDSYDVQRYNTNDSIPRNDDKKDKQEYTYKGTQLHVSCYTDIDLGGQHETRQSTSGYLLFLNGALVHYHGRTERLIIASTAAGEYIAMSRGQAACQFLTRVLQFYGNTNIQSHLYTDNQAAEHIATQPNMNEHSRSIDLRHHAVRQAYLDRIIDIKGVKTTENPSDITTKYLPVPTHITHAQYLNINFPPIPQQTTPNKLRFTNNGTSISYRTNPLPSQRDSQTHRPTYLADSDGRCPPFNKTTAQTSYTSKTKSKTKILANNSSDATNTLSPIDQAEVSHGSEELSPHSNPANTPAQHETPKCANTVPFSTAPQTASPLLEPDHTGAYTCACTEPDSTAPDEP